MVLVDSWARRRAAQGRVRLRSEAGNLHPCWWWGERLRLEMGGRGRREGGNNQVGSADAEVKASEGDETEGQKALKVPVVSIRGLTAAGLGSTSDRELRSHIT